MSNNLWSIPMKKHRTQAEFVKIAAEKRPDVTVLGVYTGVANFILLKCECGWDYEQGAGNLLAGTKGCPVCGNSGNRNQTTETFIEKAERLHGELYTYKKTVYVSAITKVTITCPIHGDFTQTPHNHLSCKSGCPKCGKRQRWSYSEWEKAGRKSKYFTGFKLYVVRCYDVDTQEEFYKIGKTYREIGIRFYDIPYEYEVIAVKEGSARFVSEAEKDLHQQLKDYKYTPTKRFNGASECFSALIMENDDVNA